VNDAGTIERSCGACGIISDGHDAYFAELKYRSVRQPVGRVDDMWFLWRLDAELTGRCNRCGSSIHER